MRQEPTFGASSISLLRTLCVVKRHVCFPRFFLPPPMALLNCVSGDRHPFLMRAETRCEICATHNQTTKPTKLPARSPPRTHQHKPRTDTGNPVGTKDRNDGSFPFEDGIFFSLASVHAFLQFFCFPLSIVKPYSSPFFLVAFFDVSSFYLFASEPGAPTAPRFFLSAPLRRSRPISISLVFFVFFFMCATSLSLLFAYHLFSRLR